MRDEDRVRLLHMIEAADLKAPGTSSLLAQNPRSRPHSKKSPPEVPRQAQERPQGDVEAYRLFVAAFCEAAGRLKQDHSESGFLEGCFPAGAPFVGIPLPVAA
jgi:hypothetical protein